MLKKRALSKQPAAPRRALLIRLTHGSCAVAVPLTLLLHGPAGPETQASHAAMSSGPFWANMRLDGFMPSESETEVLELRRCPQCGSSITKRVSQNSVHPVLADASAVVVRSLDALTPSTEHALCASAVEPPLRGHSV